MNVSSMNQANHISHEDLALLALQFLPEKELPEARAHVAQCTECREELARMQGDLAAFSLSADMHSPPAYARERLLRKISKENKLVNGRRLGVIAGGGRAFDGTEEEYAAFAATPRASRFWPWAGWAVAAALGIVAALQYTGRERAESQYHAELVQMETKSAHAQNVLQTLTDSRAKQVGIHLTAASVGQKQVPEAHAAYMADKGALVFFASNMQPLQQYKTYELWLLPANGRDPIAAGVFKPDTNGNANVLMPNLPKGVPAAGFGVTIEDDGGAKQPTLPTVMSGS